MNWLPITLLCAFSLATSDALAKRALDNHNEYVIVWLRLALAAPFLLATLCFIPIQRPAPLPPPSQTLWSWFDVL